MQERPRARWCMHASHPWLNAVIAVLFLFSRPLAASGHCLLHCAVLCCARLYNWHAMFSPPPLGQRGTAGAARHNPTGCAEHHRTMFHEMLPCPGTKRAGSDAISGGACLIRLNTPARRQSQTSASPTSWAICATLQDHGLHHQGWPVPTA